MAAAKVEPKETKFKGADLIASKKFADHRDILTALLDMNKTYSISEAEKVIDNFNKTKA